MFKSFLISGNIFKAAALLAVALFVSTSGIAANVPVINSATVDTTANTLTLSGTNLLGADGAGVFSVAVSTTGASIQLTVLNSSTTSISASFPASSPASSLKPGTYTALVRFYSITAASAVSSTNFLQFPFSIPAPGPTPPPVTPPISATSTTLLFQFVSNVTPIYGSIAITNLGTVSPSATSVASPGTCTLTFYGQNAPSPITTALIVPGTVYTNSLSGAPNFEGYVTAVCNFKAQGVAFGGPTVGGSPNYALPAIVNP